MTKKCTVNTIVLVRLIVMHAPLPKIFLCSSTCKLFHCLRKKIFHLIAKDSFHDLLIGTISIYGTFN